MQVIFMTINYVFILLGIQVLLIILCTSTAASAEDKLYIIGFGTTPGSDDENSLKKLAAQNNGQYLNAEDTSSPGMLKDALISAFSGKNATVSVTLSPSKTPGDTGKQENETASCDCKTYDPYYDESSDCYITGTGCSPCFEACYEPEKDQPVTLPARSCDCRTYDPGKESMSCMVSGRDCSACYSSCQ
jgi:hypothetical protein